MEQNFRRAADAVRLPEEARARIRAQIASHGEKQEVSVMKTKKHLPRLAVAAILIAAVLTLTAAAAAVVHTFQKTMIVSHESEIPIMDVTIEGPSGDGTMNSLEERASGLRRSDENWANVIDDGGLPDTLLDSTRMEVISTDPALRIRRITQLGGAEKMQYTAADPVDLLPMLSGKIRFDLSWMRENYAAAEGSDELYLVHDAAGAFSNEYFSALYGTQDGNGYVQFMFSYDMDKLPDQKYIAEDSYDKAYYYTTADGNEFLIKAYNETVWATCENAHAYVHLYCARLTTDAVEQIVEHLSLSISE